MFRLHHIVIVAILVMTFSHEGVAFELRGSFGYEAPSQSDIIVDSGGRGWNGRGEMFWTGNQQIVAFGLGISHREYSILSEQEKDGQELDRSGSFSTQSGSLLIEVRSPWQIISPYLGFGYGSGNSELVSKSVSSFAGQQSDYATTLNSRYKFATRGQHIKVGIASTIQSWKFHVEFRSISEVHRVTEASGSYRNTVDGEVQPVDSGEETLESIFEELEGDQLLHNSRSVLFGLTYIVN